MARPIMWLRSRPDHHKHVNQQLLYLEENEQQRRNRNRANIQNNRSNYPRYPRYADVSVTRSLLSTK